MDGPYGRCVYHCDNDVPDHQVLNAQFRNGVLFDFVMRANTTDSFRGIRISGTEGEISGTINENLINVRRFGQGIRKNSSWEIFRPEVIDGGHGGGDTGVIKNFLRLVRDEDYEEMAASLRYAVEGHMMSYAAALANLTREVVSMREYKESCLLKD